MENEKKPRVSENGPQKLSQAQIEQRRQALELEDREESLKEEFELLCEELRLVAEGSEDLLEVGDVYQYKQVRNKAELLQLQVKQLVERIHRAHQKTERYLADTGLERTFEVYQDALTEAADFVDAVEEKD